MATAPNYAATAKIGNAAQSTANTARDGTGTIATVITGGAGGTRIDNITIKATVTTTAGMVRLFLHDGTNYRLWKEILVPPITVSATVAAFEHVIDCSVPGSLLLLPSGHSLRFAPEKAENFNVIAIGADA
jgi:hypothetical protein